MVQTTICECASGALVSNYAVTWVVIILGWFIVNHQNNKRETRKEIRTQLDIFTKKIKLLEDNSIRYHKNAHHDPNLSKTIKRDIDYLIKLTKRLKLLETTILNRRIITFRKSITFDNFDNQDKHIKQNEDSPLIAAIYVSCDDFIDSLEHAYIKKFQ